MLRHNNTNVQGTHKSLRRTFICLTMVVVISLTLIFSGVMAPQHLLLANDNPLADISIEGAEGKSLSIWVRMTNEQAQEYMDLNEHPLMQSITEATGLELEFIHPTPEQMDQQLTMMISSGNFYDILAELLYPGGSQTAINENSIIDINPYLDLMPNFKRALYEPENFSSWEWSSEQRSAYGIEPEESFLKSSTTSMGELWCVPQIWTDKWPTYLGAVIRKDWLDEEGLEIPVTFDDWEIVLEAFKQRGVIPMNLHSTVIGPNWFSTILNNAYELYENHYIEEDGETIGDLAYVKPEVMDYLNRMRDWYAKGYIDPDFMNTTEDMTTAKFMSDNLGIYLFAWDISGFKNNYVGEQEFDVVPIPQPRLTEDQILRSRPDYQISPQMYFCVSSSCEYPEIACQFLDLFYNEDVMTRMIYGIEGETFEYVDGSPEYLPEFIESESFQNGMAQSNYLMTNFWPSYNSVRQSLVQNQIPIEENIDFQASLVWAGNDNASANLPYITFKDDDWGTQQEIMTNIETYILPKVVKHVIDEEELDFEQTVSDIEAMGYQEMKDLWQEGLDRYNGKIH